MSRTIAAPWFTTVHQRHPPHLAQGIQTIRSDAVGAAITLCAIQDCRSVRGSSSFVAHAIWRRAAAAASHRALMIIGSGRGRGGDSMRWQSRSSGGSGGSGGGGGAGAGARGRDVAEVVCIERHARDRRETVDAYSSNHGLATPPSSSWCAVILGSPRQRESVRRVEERAEILGKPSESEHLGVGRRDNTKGFRYGADNSREE